MQLSENVNNIFLLSSFDFVNCCIFCRVYPRSLFHPMVPDNVQSCFSPPQNFPPLGPSPTRQLLLPIVHRPCCPQTTAGSADGGPVQRVHPLVQRHAGRGHRQRGHLEHGDLQKHSCIIDLETA